jgi:UDP-N-acetylmuramate: L-alanyl-gamma-D-glutamyl-meso-diaminopimelate ligase
MHIHFIAIGGSAMHNLAIALKKRGYIVSGSDDEIFEPSKTRLVNYGLLPEKTGWFPQKLDSKPDAVILGMHARADNPELKRARDLGIRIYSYPEYLYEHSREKTRVVIGGSHGKTTITAILLHILKHAGIDADYMVGAQLEGFDVMVKLSDRSRLMILEGDEYLTSAIDRRPKFHVYRPHLALLSGISWDHINVFPTWEGYREEFIKFINLIEPEGSLVYCTDDEEVVKIVNESENEITKIPYGLPAHVIRKGITLLEGDGRPIPLKVFGRHNLVNIEGARKLCHQLGIGDKEFYSAIGSFPGASNRLELVAQNEHTAVFRDFAHSPSKLKATVEAVGEQFPERHLTACMELHTFSSLSTDFLEHYKGTLDGAGTPIVYFNPHTLELKRLPSLSPEMVRRAFACPELRVYTDSGNLVNDLLTMEWKNRNLLMMSSGNFNNINFADLTGRITGGTAGPG